MKLKAISRAAVLMLSGAFAYAQSGVPSGGGSTTGAHGGEIPAFSLLDQTRTGNLESSLSRVIG
jgi:hypothetical protein